MVARPSEVASARSLNEGRVPPLVAVLLLVLSLAIVAAVSLVGRSWTDTAAGSWYDRLDKPPWNPPGATFGIVWTVLYVLMAVGAWLVARRFGAREGVGVALAAYGMQLALNLGWTALFFAAERPGWAFAEIVVLAVAIAVTISTFRSVSTAAAWLLAPYLVWVCFAALINLAIVAAS
jgi:tryptophan-rich sensory protein